MRCCIKMLLAGLFFLVGQAVGVADEPAGQPILVLDPDGHTDSIPTIRFTPDGSRLISVSKDKTVRIWDTSTGEMLHVLRPPIGIGRAGTLYAADVSPNGRLLAVAGIGLKEGANPIYLVSLPAGRIERVLDGHSHTVADVAFSPDGKRLASAGEENIIRVWDVRTGICERVLRGHQFYVYRVAFSPDGEHLATASYDGTARLWSLQTGDQEAVLNHTTDGQIQPVHSIAWSPDGQTIATGAADQYIRLWDTSGRMRQWYGPFGDRIRTVVFTANSRALLFAEGFDRSSQAGIVDLTTGKVRARFTRHTAGVWRGVLSPNGALAATAGFAGGELYLWRTADGALVHRLGGRSQSTWSTGWSPDGKTIAWGYTGKRSYDNPIRPLERSFNVGELELGPAPDSDFHRSQTVQGELSLYRAPPPGGLQVQRDEEAISLIRLPQNPLTSFTFLPKDRVAVGATFGLYLFDAHTGAQLRSFQGHTGDIAAVSPSPDGRYFLTASADQTVRVWSPDRSQPLLSLFVAGEDWVAWTPEGYYAASPGGERLMGWQVNRGLDQLASFYPAARFRRSLYRPDVIRRLLSAGSVAQALAQANQARQQESQPTSVNQVLPPQVWITAPAGPTAQVTEPVVQVKATARSQSNFPVARLRLLLDGRPYQGQKGVHVVPAENQDAMAAVQGQWSVQLSPGRHRLVAQAETAASQGLSEAVDVTYVASGAAREPTLPSLYVLAVGIAAYPERLKLQYAAGDAQRLSQAFEKHSRALFRRVEVKLLTDQQASRRGILAGLGWLRKEMTQRDVAVFFFSGHGTKDDSGNFYLLPVDGEPGDLLSTGVGGSQLKEALAAVPGRVLVLLDACHAGAAEGDRRKAAQTLTDELVRDLATDDYGVVVMCSSMGREYSLESMEHRQGYFTLALVEGLSGKADYQGSGVIYLNELDAYVSERVKALTHGQQHPVTTKPASIRSFPLSKK